MKISLSTPIYNGLNLKQIINRLPENMIKQHKKDYLKNCIEHHKNEVSRVNLGFNECIKNTNFYMIDLALRNYKN